MNKTGPIRLTIDRQASVLSMMKWFAREGIHVLPIHSVAKGICSCGDRGCEHPGKHPIGLLVPKGANSATTDLKVIRTWHRAYPDMNYAVATNGLAIIDCDSRDALDAFRNIYGPPATLTVKTARGFHFYFRGEMPARNGAQSKLDVKSGPGCYVVGPGSVHASGAIYTLWEDEPVADLPQNIAAITERRDDPPEGVDGGLLPIGMRNTTLTKFAGYLNSRNVPADAILSGLLALNENLSTKPLSRKEVRSIVKGVTTRYRAKPLPQIVPFSEIPEEKLEWLWYPYISLRTLGLLDGSPGDGKSQFTAWLCARISRGDMLPNGDVMKPANCFLCNFEDLPGAVIRKRLEANGADLDRVFIQNRAFRLTEEMVDWLEGEIAQRKPKLVILDPIQSVMTKGTDPNSNVDVREFMDRLREVAERQGCSIICIRHFGKGSHDRAMMKGIGSTDFSGIARNQLGLIRRHDGVRGFVVSQLKTNFDEGDSVLFTMGEADGRKGEQPRIAFEKFEKIDTEGLFNGGRIKRGPEQDERVVAGLFLEEALADGPKMVADLKADAREQNIKPSSLYRARDDLGVFATKDNGKTFWALPA